MWIHIAENSLLRGILVITQPNCFLNNFSHVDIYSKELLKGNPIWSINKITNNFKIATRIVAPVLYSPSNSPPSKMAAWVCRTPSLQKNAVWILLILILIYHFLREDNNAQKSGRTYPRLFICNTWRLWFKSTSPEVHKNIGFIWSIANLLFTLLKICYP